MKIMNVDTVTKSRSDVPMRRFVYANPKSLKMLNSAVLKGCYVAEPVKVVLSSPFASRSHEKEFLKAINDRLVTVK